MSDRDALSRKARTKLAELALQLAQDDVMDDGFEDDYHKLTVSQQGAFTRADEETYLAGILCEILELRQQRLLERRDSPGQMVDWIAPDSRHGRAA